MKLHQRWITESGTSFTQRNVCFQVENQKAAHSRRLGQKTAQSEQKSGVADIEDCGESEKNSCCECFPFSSQSTARGVLTQDFLVDPHECLWNLSRKQEP